jgi:D-serine deaminase-like pyridoxal phosphate-dependent protein
LVLENRTGHMFSQGDILYGIPYHICPTVALYDSIQIIENGRCTGAWKNLARDRSITI